MLTAQTVALLEGGCSQVVGTVDAHGAPYAGRAWGVTVADDGEHPRLRVLIDVDDEMTLAQARAGGAVAVTAADVRTLVSVQVKGRFVAVGDAAGDDLARHRDYLAAFFAELVATDGTELALLERFAPIGVVPATVEVDAVFDQTPGPGAGARLSQGAP